VHGRKEDGELKALLRAGAEASIDGQKIAENAIMLSKARESFSRLPIEQRLVLTLVVIDERTYEEAAAVLGIPVGTLKSRLSRARENMRRMIEGDGDQTDADRSAE
jgi:RNA polymerase sigma-70 factor, ECF subfamily